MSLLTVISLGKFKASTGRRTKEVCAASAIHIAQRRFKLFIPDACSVMTAGDSSFKHSAESALKLDFWLLIEPRKRSDTHGGD